MFTETIYCVLNKYELKNNTYGCNLQIHLHKQSILRNFVAYYVKWLISGVEM